MERDTDTRSPLVRPARHDPSPSDEPAPDRAGWPAPALRLPGPCDLLAYLPFRLGFRPRDSVVAVGLRTGGTVGVVARVDVADLAGPSGRVLALDLLGHLLADGARVVQVVLYTDADPRRRDPDSTLHPDRRAPEVRAARRLQRACDPQEEPTVWVVTAQGYLDLDCTDAACCPPGGRDLADLAAAPVVDRMSAAGVTVAASREDVGRLARAGKGARRSASSARLRWADALVRARRAAAEATAQDGAGGGETGADGTEGGAAGGCTAAPGDTRAPAGPVDPVLRWRRESITAWSQAVAIVAGPAAGTGHGASDGTDGTDGQHGPDGTGAGRASPATLPARLLGRIEASLADGVLRDAVLVDLVDPDPTAAARVVEDAGRPGQGDVPAGAAGGARASVTLGPAVAGLLDPCCARSPDDVRTGAARHVLEGVVAHGRPGRQAPALTLLALLAWWSGDGVLAAVRVEAALGHGPGYELARVVQRLVASGLAPAWVRRDG